MKYLCLLLACLVAASSANQEGIVMDIVCDTCEFVGHEIDTRLLTKDTKQKILDFGKMTCSKLPMFAKECGDAVDTYGPEAIAMLFKKFDVDRVCAQVHLCPATNLVDGAFYAHGTTSSCRACKDGFDVVKMIINSAEVRDMVHIAVNESCIASTSNAHNVDVCERLAGKIADEILGNLLPLFDTEGICTSMGVCTSSSPLLHTSPEGCKACVAALDLVDVVLKSNDLKELADVAMDELCIVMGGRVDVCQKILRGIIDPIITNVVQLFDPKMLCSQAGACPAKHVTAMSLVGSNVFCDPCKQAIQELHNIVEDNETDTLLTELSGILCNFIEIPFCKSVMTAIINESLEDVDHTDPAGTCAGIGACNSAVAFYDTPSKLEDNCSECTEIATQIKAALSNPEIVTLLKDAVGELCSILPITDCAETLDGYLDQAVALIKTLDPKTLCTLIGMC